MAVVIGLDFGNFNSYSCFIQDFDENTRLGGMVNSLLPPNPQYRAGIPSEYFYSSARGEVVGYPARMANPSSNRLHYLKRHMGEEKTIDGRVVSYDDAIVAVIQHCIRSANQQLMNGFRLTTNLISLAYPATFTSS